MNFFGVIFIFFVLLFKKSVFVMVWFGLVLCRVFFLVFSSLCQIMVDSVEFSCVHSFSLGQKFLLLFSIFFLPNSNLNEPITSQS